MVALGPIRSRLLFESAEPVSAATLATRVGLSRQKVNSPLIALGARVVREMGDLVRRANEAGKRLATLTAAAGLKGVSVGQRWTAPAGVPAFSGVVEFFTQSPYDALLRLDKPGPGIAALGAMNFGGQRMVVLGFYLYGDETARIVAHDTPLWDAWIQKSFPMPIGPG